MRVEFDDQIFRLQRFGGISRYFAQLAAALVEGEDVRLLGLPLLSGNEHLGSMGRRYSIGPKSRALRRMIRESSARLRERHPRSKPGLLHHTFYDPRYLPLRGPRSITTIHDMTPELFPQLAGGAHAAKREYYERADALLFVSETSKNDCEEIFGSRDVPTYVAPLGVGHEFHANSRPKTEHAPRDPIVLYVGVRSHYKDFALLLQAFGASNIPRNARLIALGGPEFNSEERRRIVDLGLHDRVEHRTFSDRELPTYYAKATVFVFPSRYEGFGLPTLEAMASGCPVLASDAPALKEVSGGAALHFEAGQRDSLESSLAHILEDSAARERLRAAGLERARQFTWQRTAEITVSAYREARL